MAGPSPYMTRGKSCDAARVLSQISNLEKHRLVVALQVDVEAIDGRAVALLAPGDQGGAAIGRDQRHYGVSGVGGLAVEIDPRVVMQQHAAREHREQDMRRLRLGVRSGPPSRL